MTERFRPTRAGVINIWDYVDEEWAFAGGRLALRGHNGSGKTKALEVLFPFVFDGVADSRRLDPFSGENRTMKSNLLYRGQESEYGYIWMEFARPRPAGSTETITLIVGIRAHRSTDGVRSSFYVTGRRLGVDFGLLSADSRPLTERQLRGFLEPEAWRKTATEYRDLIDSRLFGLGRQRYAQLLDLLLALRRPLLAQDLDPVKVSDTLSSGLSPVDEDLVQQAARDFENLAAVQKLFDDLTAAKTATTEFLVHYEAYLRANVRFQLDRIQARAATAASHAEQITAAAAQLRQALTAEREAQGQRDAQREAGLKLQARLAALKNSDEYKAQGRIEDKRREVAQHAAGLIAQRRRLGKDRDGLTAARDLAAKLSRRAGEARSAAARLAVKLEDAARRSGIADDGFGPVDPGDELLVTARARVAARRDDIGEIRRLLQAVGEAQARRTYTDEELGKKQTAEQHQRAAADTAAGSLAQARQSASAELTAWTSRWAGLIASDDAAALAQALEQAGEPGAANLGEVLGRRSADRREAAVQAQANLGTKLAQARDRLAGLRAERDEIAGERDDAPPPSDLRPASRQDRPGAALWQLVRFADGVDDAQAAAIEGALYGAGLLTAWVHPDPALTGAALAGAEADGYLVATQPVPGGRTLADVLVPEEQQHVARDVIAAVLCSVAFTDDLAGPPAIVAGLPAAVGGPPAGLAGVTASLGGAAGSPPPAKGIGGAAAVVSAKAQFSYGLQVGARPKQAPEYIGATNRAARRQARLAGQDQLIAQAAAAGQKLETELEELAGLLADLQRSRRELPDIVPVARAAQAAGRAAALLTQARDQLQDASKALDKAIAEVDARSRQLRTAAAERRMPTASEDVDSIARAAAQFEAAASDLNTQRAALTQAQDDLTEQTEVVSRQQAELAGAEEAFAGQERAQAALEEEFATLEESLHHSVQEVLEQIRVTDRQLAAAQDGYKQFDARVQAEHDAATRAQTYQDAERQVLAEAVGQLLEQAAAFSDYARPDLRPLLGVAVTTPWPGAAGWPDPVQVSGELADALAGGADEAATGSGADGGAGPDPATAVWSVMPGGVSELTEAFTAAVRGGRQVTEGTLKNVADRMSGALKDFTEALAVCDSDYRTDWEPGAVVTVNVIDDEGRRPVGEFATRVAERAGDQGILLEDRERKVLEDELLAALAQQIHGRVLAARDLSRDMNADTRSKPMSSGIAVGIRWAQSDTITDRQRVASRLTERDSPGPERLAELRGVLRDMIREYRASHPRATYRETLGSVLDYRSWHSFELVLIEPGKPETRLTRSRHSSMSGGEKSAAIHLPLFAAANALYSSAAEHCPRMIALDEAFVGIDERYKPDLFGLAVKFDLDLFMTGHDLWVTTATVPMIAHYDMYHDKTTRTVSALLMLWDGDQLVDASAGYRDNEALVEEVLGFRPTRYAPLGSGGTLYAELAAGADGDGDDLDEDDL